MKRGLSILGSTGSVGCNVLRIVDAFPDRFEVVGLAAGGNVDRLAEQVARYRPRVVSVASEEARAQLAQRTDVSGLRLGVGPDAAVAVATHPDATMVVAAAVGAVGLVPTYRALEAGKDVALANKETLVMAGELMVAQAKARGARLLPIDSEHCALHQCLDGRRPEEVQRLVLTASGGPIRNRPRESFRDVTPGEALQHPTWNMGRKITIDSATLMNKGLEVIEARWLFGVAADRIEVLVHPQSVVHSMVEMIDGSIIAQLGVTDMRLPIQYAFSYPDRWAAPMPPLDLIRCGPLEFEVPDTTRFPCLRLAFRALEGDPGLAIVLNAANEVAVAAFLDGTLPFNGIPEVIGCAMDAHDLNGTSRIRDLDDVRVIDEWARTFAARSMSGLQ